jgi:hypothetical protein
MDVGTSAECDRLIAEADMLGSFDDKVEGMVLADTQREGL